MENLSEFCVYNALQLRTLFSLFIFLLACHWWFFWRRNWRLPNKSKAWYIQYDEFIYNCLDATDGGCFHPEPITCPVVRTSVSTWIILCMVININQTFTIVIKVTRIIIYYARRAFRLHKTHQWRSYQNNYKAKQIQSWRALRIQNSKKLCQIRLR